jgi:hypothetical protein
MERLVQEGDGKAVEAFILEHFTELPEEVQAKALMHFTEEALAASAVETDIAALRKEGMEALKELAAAKAALRDGDR